MRRLAFLSLRSRAFLMRLFWTIPAFSRVARQLARDSRGMNRDFRSNLEKFTVVKMVLCLTM